MASEYQTGIWRVSANLLTYARITKRYLEHQKSSILNSNKFAFKLPKLAFKMPKIDILNDTNWDLSFMKFYEIDPRVLGLEGGRWRK